MIRDLAAHLKISTGKKYHWRKQKVKSIHLQAAYVSYSSTHYNSCLAHVINLVTQMLISMYSKSPHFDPKQPDAHVATSCDEVGLMRVIVVKVQIICLS
jgi:hypothetical protein